MKLPAWLAAAIAALGTFLPGCDAVNVPAIKPGISTAAEVRARMGVPSAEYRNADGSVVYEYNRQPNGIECFMITLGSNQVVSKIEQVLTEANFAKVTAGMDRDELRRLLGKPGSVATYSHTHEEVWDWRIAGTIPTEEAHFHVHFDTTTGLVKRTSRRVEIRG